MNFTFDHRRISGVLAVVPENEIRFEDELSNYSFSEKQSLKLKRIMGYNRHRVVNGNVCVSDMCIFGLNYLFDQGLLAKDEIDAMILVTQTPDYFLPPTSNVIQGKLGLKEDMMCIDINQGCAGYIIGLMQAFDLLHHESVQKVVLLNADILSRKTSKRDRNSFPIIGDAATITVVEKSDQKNTVYSNLKMDGSKSEVLIIPAGGLRIPASLETSVEKEDEGNFRSLEHLKMDGTAVFNFVQSEVPPMIDSLFEFAGSSLQDADYFLFHQPNRFMLEKLADKLGVSYEKLPNNVVENFGNSSSATIPLNVAFNLGEKILENSYQVCLAGFGVGLTWGSMLMEIGNLDFCSIIDY
jgi:3-oxoacyl-[acyl-carrier-protein] synthase III